MTKLLRILGYILLNVPAYFIKAFLGMPNTRIVYKTGHVEDYFFYEINWTRTGSGITKINWKSTGMKAPKFINPDEIMSIVELY